MARQNLNRGTTANDGTGDTLRQAANKINDNFIELYGQLGGDSALTSVTLTQTGVVFEGQTVDDFETTLCAVEPTADRIVYVPNDGGTLILDSCQQTLTNKTILSPSLTTPSIKDNDSSHSYNFVLGNLTANRNITIPTLSTNDTFVFANATQTLTNKTIQDLTIGNPKLTGITNGSNVLDSADNKYMQFVRTASAVNHLQIGNNATGANPYLDVEGTDTNISLELRAKGTGGVEIINKLVLEKGTDVTGSTAVDMSEPLTIFNSGSAITPTLGDGTIIGETKFFSNVGAGEVRLTPAGASTNIFGVDSADGFIIFDEGDGCQLVWNETKSKWYFVSNNGTTTG